MINTREADVLQIILDKVCRTTLDLKCFLNAVGWIALIITTHLRSVSFVVSIILYVFIYVILCAWLEFVLHGVETPSGIPCSCGHLQDSKYHSERTPEAEMYFY